MCADLSPVHSCTLPCVAIECHINTPLTPTPTAATHLPPKIIAKLDDSSDVVRVSMCGTLSAFLQCGLPQHYKGAMLDQLFTPHLDDADVNVQHAGGSM